MGAGLRERHRRQTRERIGETAIGLFVREGFTAVSLADVAAAADVSKPTLFAYFSTKEDMALYRLAGHDTEAAMTVAQRAPSSDPLSALHDHFRTGLQERDPVTGLCDDPGVLAYHQLVTSTPGLVGRLALYNARQDAALADALAAEWPTEQLKSNLVAVNVLAAHRLLATRNIAAIAADSTAGERHPAAVTELTSAYELIRHGAG